MNNIPIVVTATDGVTTNTYNLSVTRPALPTVSYTGLNVYAVGTAIAPLTPTSSNVSGISYSAATSVFNNGGYPGALAVSTAGVEYVGSQGSLDMVPAGGGASVNISTGFNYISGVAVDASGNVYVSDEYGGTITEITNPGQPGSVSTVLISGLSYPGGIAVDAAGSIYVTEIYNNNDLLKYPVVGGVAGAPIIITAALGTPNGVAIDNAGNLYISDSQSSTIFKIPASVKSYPVSSGSFVSIGSGFSSPSGVAVDNTGSVYVADPNNNIVERIDASGNTTTLASGLGKPWWGSC